MLTPTQKTIEVIRNVVYLVDLTGDADGDLETEREGDLNKRPVRHQKKKEYK